MFIIVQGGRLNRFIPFKRHVCVSFGRQTGSITFKYAAAFDDTVNIIIG